MPVHGLDFQKLILVDHLVRKDSHTFVKNIETWWPLNNFEIGLSRVFGDTNDYYDVFIIKDSSRKCTPNPGLERFLDE